MTALHAERPGDGPLIGRAIARSEDRRFLNGTGRFVDDLAIPGALHAAIVRSAYAHAAIRGIDFRAARAMPGVVAVLTFADIARHAGLIPLRLAPIEGWDRYLQRPLAHEVARYAGEPIAVVVAASRYEAEDAALHVAVDYAPKTPVLDRDGALAAASLVHEAVGTNLAFRYDVARGDAEAVFARADHRVAGAFRMHRHGAVPLETRGLVAAYDRARGTLEVWGATKVTFFNRRTLAAFLEMDEAAITLYEPDVGGGFGSRGEFYPEDLLIPLAAVRLGRPVKWIEDRREHLLAANHSRDVACALEIAAAEDGTILGMRATIIGDMGAYARTNGGVVPAKAAQFLPGPYRIDHFACTVEAIITNKTPVGTYRGPGRFEANFFRECLIDRLARRLGIDRAELRLRNLLRPADLPYGMGPLVPYETADTLDIGDAGAALRTVLDALGYARLAAQSGRLVDGRLHGIGMATFTESGGSTTGETARIRLTSDGAIELMMGSTTMGQGHETVFAQVLADALGVPFETITVRHGSTDLVPIGWGSFASRGMVMGGGAVLQAAATVKTHLARAAALRLNMAEDEIVIAGGAAVRRQGGAPLLDFAVLVAAAAAHGGTAAGDVVLDIAETYQGLGRTYSHGAHAAHVAVDPETGAVEVLRYVTAEDVGRAINPMIVHGQAIGAAIQGLGASFLDCFLYDGDGQLLTATLADYLLPTATDFPRIDSITLEDAPSKTNPLGVKGAGEGGIVAVGACVACAVNDALRSYGAAIDELPIRPDRIVALIRAAEAKGREGP
ncbi:MAG: xanthine dehydrogenase family protein molybdopterin-binding subunit [Alphaproteobacteria bacterium]|nr:xanthine dehydrogenase family protein molybdopterin-binding subunit [Alphaproteobacteria bacterium]